MCPDMRSKSFSIIDAINLGLMKWCTLFFIAIANEPVIPFRIPTRDTDKDVDDLIPGNKPMLYYDVDKNNLWP